MKSEINHNLTVKTLRPYQTTCLNAIQAAVRSGKKRMLAHLACGGGKTVIFSELPKLLNSRRTMVVAHRGELLIQAKSKLEDAGLTSELEQASNRASSTCPVVVASIQSLNTNGRLYKFSQDEFDLIIIDECHRAAAKSYLRVVDYFSKSIVIGFTATPYRSDDADLLEVFTDGVVFSMGLEELTKQGFLAPIHKVNRPVPSLGAGNVLRVYKDLANSKKTIIFCHDVDHSVEVAQHFNANGIKAAFVHGGMAKNDREETLKQFSKNGIKVLANCNVLTEGYDEPSVQCVMLARNTMSQGLYEQMIGRGTRLCEGKTHLQVIELEVAPAASTTPFLPSWSPPPHSIQMLPERQYGADKYFSSWAEHAFYIFMVLVILIGSFIGLGYAIKHCNQELQKIDAPSVNTVKKIKKVKHGKRKHHADNSRRRANTKSVRRTGVSNLQGRGVSL